MDFLSLITLGVTAFIATNVDDVLILVLFFGDRRFRAREVCAGQALGIAVLVMVSLTGALLALAVPRPWVGLLGLLPIALGTRELSTRWRGKDEEAPRLDSPIAPGARGWRRAAAVAGVTVANGGDNIGVYVPLFAGRAPGQTALLLVTFAAMLAVWLLATFYLTRRSTVAGQVQRIGHAVFPYVLIGLGMVILIEAFVL
jgi:cadmium resistance protein CadD (predicted permease)